MADFQGTMMPLSIITLFYVMGFPDHGFRGFHIAPINKHPFPNFFWIFLKFISHFYEEWVIESIRNGQMGSAKECLGRYRRGLPKVEEKVFCWGSLPELILPAQRR